MPLFYDNAPDGESYVHTLNTHHKIAIKQIKSMTRLSLCLIFIEYAIKKMSFVNRLDWRQTPSILITMIQFD